MVKNVIEKSKMEAITPRRPLVNCSSCPQITLTKAKKILGTTAKGLSDDALRKLIVNVEALTDIVVAHAHDSIIKSSIDILDNGVHTND